MTKQQIDAIVLAEMDCGMSRTKYSVYRAVSHRLGIPDSVTLALWRLLARKLIRVTWDSRLQLTDLGRERA